VAYQERTSFNLILNKFKEAEEDMPAPFRKRKRLRKYPLPVNNSALKAIIKTLPDIQKKNKRTRIAGTNDGVTA